MARPLSELKSLASQGVVPNLDRALTIMEDLARHSSSGVADIAKRLRMPKNSVFRIMLTLAERGYVIRDDASKQYQLGSKLLSLGYAALHEGHLVERSLDVMRDLRDLTGESVLVGILVKNEGVVLEECLSTQKIKVVVGVGERFPLHTAAPGKAIVAALPESEQAVIINQLDFAIYNKHTIDNAADYRKELDLVRKHGYSTDEAEEIEGLHCVGAPVLDISDYPIGAIWLNAPSYRLPAKRFAETGARVLAAAQKISNRFGNIGGF